MENTYFTWDKFANNYHDQALSADQVFNNMLEGGLQENSLLEFDFHFLSDSKEKLEALAQFLSSSYSYRLKEIVQTESGLWEFSGVTNAFPVTADNMVYWSLDLYKRGYEHDAELDGYGAMYDKDNQSFPDFDNTSADVFFDLGIDLYNNGDLSGSIIQWSNVLVINSKDVDALYSRAIVKNELYASSAAMSDYDRAIEIAPNFFSALLNRGALKDDLKDHQGAIDDYDQVIKSLRVEPETLQRAHMNKGNSLLSLKNTPAACESWSKARDLGEEFAQQLIDKHCSN
ncbi:hypothetical protein FE810_11740 [Thalassotalea litorea]|uniref:Regulator of ribonuclease activity B domain-containing protein n=2 Tax=Thalassotalea litorea TaxID=2020715 RepID=A0A5R9IIS4_9GAMM|nr:hypothetical protein FE810_11740 [Thalassotalea litorea]